ncbi:MAG: hypothetical protein E2P05_08425 [Acidobacteria bacterium]|nr:MAG: hypothetical protein E2P05_08425 [Acidobacteriota bacterium]
MFIVGMVLFVFAEQVAPYMRLLLPLPPISVAAYIYVLNKLNITPEDPTVPGKRRALLADVLTETAVGVIVFLALSLLMLGVLHTVPASIRSDLAKEKILLIAIMGVAMLVAGVVLYALAGRVASHWRFLLPLPPISVASYIYVLNRMSEPSALAGAATLQADVRDLFLQTVIGTVAFFGVVILILFVFSVGMRSLNTPTT